MAGSRAKNWLAQAFPLNVGPLAERPASLPLWELAGVGALFFLLWLGGALGLGGGPLLWDDLLYLNLALDPTPRAEVLNRFWHVYLLKAFIWDTAAPLACVKFYWWFVMAATASLTYLNARLLTGRSSLLCGVAAVLILLAQPPLFEHTGSPLADYTQMFMTSVVVALFLGQLHARRRRWAWLLALGAALALALRANEIVVGAGVLLLALGWQPERGHRWGDLGRAWLWVALGGLAGVMLMALLNWAALGEPLFGWRAVDLAANTEFNWQDVPRRGGNWFHAILGSWLAVPFVLAYASYFMTLREDRDPPRLAVWLLPLTVMALLTVVMIRGAAYVKPRYFFLMYPVIALLAAQAIRAPRPAARGQVPRQAAWAGAALVIGVAAMWALAWLARSLDADWNDYWLLHYTILYPAAVAALLITLMAWRREPLAKAAVLLACIAAYAWPLLIYNQGLALKSDARVRHRFAPLAVAAAELTTPRARAFVSATLFREHYIMGRDAEKDGWMHKAVFGATAPLAHYDHGKPEARLWSEGYDVVMLAPEDLAGAAPGCCQGDAWRAPGGRTYVVRQGPGYTVFVSPPSANGRLAPAP